MDLGSIYMDFTPSWSALAEEVARREREGIQHFRGDTGAPCPAAKHWNSHPECLWNLYPRKSLQIRWRNSWIVWSTFEVSPALSRRLVWMAPGVPSNWSFSAITWKDNVTDIITPPLLINLLITLYNEPFVSQSQKGIFVLELKKISFHIYSDNIRY